ncbi:MAG: CDF family Co(II)/Ni(II) efflux transporter DmeF [Roseiarcus sp.]
MMSSRHGHVFLGEAHAESERAMWSVIALASAMMVVEIVGGLAFGSIALIADGLHMSTHAGALLIAALAYTFARRWAHDPAFTFGAGKLGDLAGYSSALILGLVALGIAYEAVRRLFAPMPIDFAAAIPIAALGLAVNVASAWLLSRGGHDHHHHHHDHNHADDAGRRVVVGAEAFRLEIFERGVPPRFRVTPLGSSAARAEDFSITTLRPARQEFRFAARDGYFESVDEVPEPHAFEAILSVGAASGSSRFEEHPHTSVGRDNNMRAALLHVVADAAVSVLVIVGLTLAKLFGWLWMDPVAGLGGAAVIASWSYQLIRDTARVLVDMNPDRNLSERLRAAIEHEGDEVADLHIWRLGPGHLGAILVVETIEAHEAEHYRAIALGLANFSHLTIEVARRS